MVSSKVQIPESLSGKTFLIAGAAGFVPSHVCQYFLERGASVVGLDNLITGSNSNIELLSKYPNFEFHSCNIFENLPDFSALKMDYILSMASPASPLDFETLPIEIMRVNSEGTRNLLEVAKDKGACFLEASTSEVYGDPEVHPQKETYLGAVNPIGIRSCYDESKRFAEAMTMSYHRRYGVDTRIVRIFNTYGPRMRPNDGRVIPNFISQALRSEPLTVFGDGSQTRSFCYVSDLVCAISYVLFGNDPTPFNCGNPDEYTILETAKKIISLMGSKSEIKHLPLPQDDPKQRRPDMSKLQAVCAYQPKISFAEGIAQTVAYFKEQEK